MKQDKTITKSMGGIAVFVVAWAISLVAIAADTHDYSTYIRLRSSTTCNGGWPAADKWNPQGEMTDSGYYLIPSSVTLTSSTTGSAGPDGGTWPGMEIAIQGTFSVQASNDRTKAAVTPRLALLSGGKLTFGNYAYSTVNGNTLDIRGTSDNPSSIEYRYATSSDRYNYYPQLNIAFTGDEDCVVKFRYSL